MVRARPSAPHTSSIEVLQTIAWAGRIGFKVVPVHPRSKAAVNRDYVRVDYRSPPDDMWRARELNVGLALGARQRGPVDGDLDCDEAIALAPRFLPPTPAVFGRASRPRSHYLWRVDVAEFPKITFTDPTFPTPQTILELRGDGGHQTVAPGSIHESGERVEWDTVAFPEVPEVKSDDLVMAGRKLALAVLTARHVWKPGFHNEPCKHLAGAFWYAGWAIEEAENFISAVMEYTGDDDRSRLPTVRLTYRRAENGRKVTGLKRLGELLGGQMEPLISRMRDLLGDARGSVLQEYNERFACVTIEGKFRIARTDVAPGDHLTLFLKDDFINAMAADRIEVANDAGKIKKVPKAQIWLADQRRQQYDLVDFRPGDDSDFEIQLPGGGVRRGLNLWTGWGVPPAPPGPEALLDCTGWLTLLYEVICGGERVLSDWLLHWFASIIRRPMDKPGTAVVMIGEFGAGKSLLLAYFGRILGKAYVPVTQEEHIHGRFSGHLENALLLHSEEALYAGDKRHQGILKSLITDEFRMGERKNVDAFRVRNYMRVVLTSNELHAAPARVGDRRFTVIDLGKRKIDPPLLEQVLQERDGKGPAALHRFLLDMDYDDEMARVNVKNDALVALKEENLTPVEAWWRTTLMSGQLLPDSLHWAQAPERVDWPNVVGGPALYIAYRMFYASSRIRGSEINNISFANQIDRLLGTRLNRQQRQFANPYSGDNSVPEAVRMLNSRQLAITDLPTLEDCRRAFDMVVGQGTRWPGPEVEMGPEREKHERY